MAVADKEAQEAKPQISADTLTVRRLQSADLDRGVGFTTAPARTCGVRQQQSMYQSLPCSTTSLVRLCCTMHQTERCRLTM